jgi:hypothetical protein
MLVQNITEEKVAGIYIPLNFPGGLENARTLVSIHGERAGATAIKRVIDEYVNGRETTEELKEWNYAFRNVPNRSRLRRVGAGFNSRTPEVYGASNETEE